MKTHIPSHMWETDILFLTGGCLVPEGSAQCFPFPPLRGGGKQGSGNTLVGCFPDTPGNIGKRRKHHTPHPVKMKMAVFPGFLKTACSDRSPAKSTKSAPRNIVPTCECFRSSVETSGFSVLDRSEVAVARERERLALEKESRGWLLEYPRLAQRWPAWTPYPPLLDPAKPRSERATYCATLLDTGIEWYFGRKQWSLKRCTKTSRTARAVLAAADLFVELEIEPARWIYFAMRAWDDMGKSGLPPIGFLLGKDFMAERSSSIPTAAIFARRWLVAPAAEELLARWVPYLAEASRSDSSGILGVYERHFPDGLRDRLCLKAASQTVSILANYELEVERGVWVWK